MKAPKNIIAMEAAQTEEVKAAGKKAHEALFDKNMSDEEADKIIIAYNAMPNAVALQTRAQLYH